VYEKTLENSVQYQSRDFSSPTLSGMNSDVQEGCEVTEPVSEKYRRKPL
jgi:hypothetical protein